jgi:hypothetical protein
LHIYDIKENCDKSSNLTANINAWNNDDNKSNHLTSPVQAVTTVPSVKCLGDDCNGGPVASSHWGSVAGVGVGAIVKYLNGGKCSFSSPSSMKDG